RDRDPEQPRARRRARPRRRSPPPSLVRLEAYSSSDLRMDLEGHDICKRRAIPVFATPFQALLAAPAPRRRGCRESTTSRPARKLPRATRGASGESLGRFSEIPIAAGRLFGLSTFTHTDNFGAVVLMESRVGTAGSLDLVDGNPIDH